MSAAEAPKPEQIQANVAAALSRLRGELGAASSPVAGSPALNPVPKTPAESVPAEPNRVPGPGTAAQPAPFAPMPTAPTPSVPATPVRPEISAAPVGPLPAGPVRTPEAERPTSGIRPFEPTLGAALGSALGSAAAEGQPAAKEEAPKPDLFGALRADPALKTEREPGATAETQPDLLSGMEVPPASPPPLGSFESEDEVGGRGKRMRNRLLALLVLAIIIGGGAWAYLAKHRGADGPIPVISADTSPEKVKPADEGGMQVPNQNVQILDNMNGQATGQGQENVLPPPEQPVAPPAADNAAPAAPTVTDTTAGNANAPAAVDQPAAPSVPAPAIPSVSAPEPGQSVVTSAAPATTGTATTGNAPTPQTQQAAPEPTAPVAATPAKTEPAKPATQTAAAPSVPAAPTTNSAAGDVRIQLAAVKSEEAATTQWAKLQKAHPDLLGGLTLNVEKVDKGGATFYRIQAGPLSNKTDAKALCTKLQAQKQDCIVAK